MDHPRLLAPSADQSRERVHVLAHIDDVLRVRRIRLRVLLRFFHVPIDQRLRLEVGHALRGFDQRLAHASRFDIPHLVVADNRGLRVPEHTLLERADAVGQHLGKHRDHQARQVHRVPTLRRFFVQSRPLIDEVRYIRDVDAQLPIPIVKPLERDRIVVILRVRRIDRADQIPRQVPAHIQRLDPKLLIQRHLFIKPLRRFACLLDTRFREVIARE